MEDVLEYLKGDGLAIRLLLEASGLGIFLFLFYKGLKTQIDSLKIKFDDLKDSYDSFREAQKDITDQYIKLNETLNNYNDGMPDRYLKIGQDTLIPKNEEIKMLRDMLELKDKNIENLKEERDRVYAEFKELIPILAKGDNEVK